MKQILAVAFFLVIVTGCSDYQKVLKSANYEEKFLFADRAYQKENYSRAIALYEQIYQRMPRSDKGELAYYRLGKSYYIQENFMMAGYYFTQFVDRFPNSKNTEEALFSSAICAVRQSPKATLDQTDTKLALNQLQKFVLRFPSSKYIDSCNHIMDRLHLKIETKKFNAVQLYDKMERYRAAKNAANDFLIEYPRTNFMKEATHILYRNAYWLAKKSVLSKKKERIEEAMNIYTKYESIFKEEKYANKATKRYSDLQLILGLVDEKYAYNDLVEAFNKSNTSSTSKKMHYLNETIKRFDTFASQYPNSDLLDKAENVQKKARRELKNIKKD